MSSLIEPRKKQVSDLLQKFREGAEPTSLFSIASKNTVYFWYKIHLILETQQELSKILLNRNVNRLSAKEWEKILKAVRNGKFE